MVRRKQKELQKQKIALRQQRIAKQKEEIDRKRVQKEREKQWQMLEELQHKKDALSAQLNIAEETIKQQAKRTKVQPKSVVTPFVKRRGRTRRRNVVQEDIAPASVMPSCNTCPSLSSR